VKFCSDRCHQAHKKATANAPLIQGMHPPPAALIDTIGNADGEWIGLGLKTAARRVIMRDA